MASEIAAARVPERQRAKLSPAFLLSLACGFLVQSAHLFGAKAFPNLDLFVHYHYAREYAAAIAAGDYWPRWAFAAQHGLGEPGLVYYAPLYYYATALFARLTGNVWMAMQVVEILSAGVLGLFVHKLSACYAPQKWALWSIPLAIFSPMLCLLQLGFNGFPWAVAFAPLAILFWALLRPDADKRWVNIPAVVALALTVSTHTVTGLMAVVAVGALCARALLPGQIMPERIRHVLTPILVITLGLMLCAAYLYPAFGLQRLIDSSVWRKNYTPFNAFSLSTVTAWQFGIRWFAFQWPISFILIAMCGAGGWIIQRCQAGQAPPSFLIPAMITVATATFLSVELSYPLWLINSPLRNVQFPHRFMSLLGILAPVLTVVALGRRDSGSKMLRLALGALATGSVLMGGLVIVKSYVTGKPPLDIREGTLQPYTGLDEYRTKASHPERKRVHSFDWTRQCADHGAVCGAGERFERGLRWRVETGQATALLLPVYDYPAWQLSVNGLAVATQPDASSGLVVAHLPKGKSVLNLQWMPLPEERRGIYLSLLALLLLGMIVIAQRRSPAIRIEPAA
jgi:hypothetical protein